MSNIIMNKLIQAEKDLITTKVNIEQGLKVNTLGGVHLQHLLNSEQKLQKEVDQLKREINSLNLLTPQQIITISNTLVSHKISRLIGKEEKQMTQTQPLIFILQKGEQRSIILEIDQTKNTNFYEPISQPKIIDNLLLDYFAIKNVVVI